MKPKTFKGWAVFHEACSVALCWTIRGSRTEAIEEYMRDYEAKFGWCDGGWKEVQKKFGATCRRVTVTPEETSDAK